MEFKFDSISLQKEHIEIIIKLCQAKTIVKYKFDKVRAYKNVHKQNFKCLKNPILILHKRMFQFH